MDIKGLAQVLGRHHRALDVPARITPAPGTGPAQDMALLGLFPHRKVSRVALVRIDRYPGAFLLVFYLRPESLPYSGQLATSK